MIHEVDESLRAFIVADPANAGVDVSFESPTRDWAARRAGPAINVFLHNISEDQEFRHIERRPVRDESGKIVRRRDPSRSFKLTYLVSAWTQRAEDEHRLLAGLLLRFLQVDTVPDEFLRGSLLDSDEPVALRLAQAKAGERPSSELWSALGGELKPSLDLVVLAPVDPNRSYEVGPPVLEQPHLGVDLVDADGRAPRPTVTPRGDGSDEVRAGGADQPGRQVVVHRREPPR